MIQKICDRCGCQMNDPLEQGITHVDGHVIIRAKSGNIRDSWEIIDLCGSCRESFRDWLDTYGEEVET